MKVLFRKTMAFFLSLTLLLGIIGAPTMVAKASVFKDGVTTFQDNKFGPCDIPGGLPADNEVRAEVNGYKFSLFSEGNIGDSQFRIDDRTVGSQTGRYLVVETGVESVYYEKFQVSLSSGNSLALSVIEVAAHEVMGDLISLKLTGYKNGIPVPGAEYIITESGSYDTEFLYFNVSEMREFQGIDSFTISAAQGVLDRAIIVKSIEAYEIPNSNNPGTGEPGTGEPGTGEPGTGEPGTGNPGTSIPDSIWNALKATIESYRGASGTFTADVNKVDNTVTVTGAVTGANMPLSLNIPEGVTVIWKAELDGTLQGQNSLLELWGYGKFILAQGGNLTTIGGYAVIGMLQKFHSVTVDGGIIDSSSMFGITANGDENKIIVLDGAINAKSGTPIGNMGTSSVTWINGGLVSAIAPQTAAILSQGLIKVTNGAIKAYKGNAIATLGNVIIDGTGIVYSSNGIAINSLSPNATVRIEGGIVFSYYNETLKYDAIKIVNPAGLEVTSNGTIVKWDMSSGKTNYSIGTNEDIIILSDHLVASWATVDDKLNIVVDGADMFYHFPIPELAGGNGPDPEPVYVESIQVQTPPTKIIYNEGDTLDLSGLVVTINNSDGSSKNVAYADFEDNGISTNPENGAIIDGEMIVVIITYKEEDLTETVYQPLTINTDEDYSVFIEDNGHGTASANKASAKAGAEITLTAIPHEGYHLEEWYVIEGNITITNNQFIMPTESVLIRAIFEEDEYHTINFHASGIVSEGRLVAHGTKIGADLWPANPSKAGFTFGGWYTGENGTGTHFTSEVIITSDMTVYAKWIPITAGGGSNDNEHSGGNTGTIPTTSTEQITVDVKQGSTDSVAAQILIQRTTKENGQKSDQVSYDTEKAKETVSKLKAQGKDTARIVIPDEKDVVSETTVNIQVTSVETLANGKINLQIDTEEAKIFLSKESVNNISKVLTDELYFRLVPVKDDTEKESVSAQAKLKAALISNNTNSITSIIGNPITIETNMPSTETDIILPLTGVKIPVNTAEKEALLKQLAVYIEHSDGDKELVQGELVTYKDGVYGIRFQINKFSTFTVVKTDAFLQTKGKEIIKFTAPANAVIKESNITAFVANSVSSVTVKAVVSNQATYRVYLDKALKKEAVNNKLSLKTGANISYVKVTAQDNTTKVYKLSITRNKNWRAEVTKLFTPEKAVINENSITASVPNDKASLIVKASVSNKATYKLYSDKALKKVIKSNKLNLKVGTNTVYVKVTAENGKSTKVYTLTITRKAEVFNTHVRLGVIGSKTYAEKVARIFDEEYATANVTMKEFGKYYLVTMDFKDSTAANKACQDMIRREYIINYYVN